MTKTFRIAALAMACAILPVCASAKVLAYPADACATIHSTNLTPPIKQSLWLFQMSCADETGAVRLLTFTWDYTWGSVKENTPPVITLIPADVKIIEER